VTGDPGTAGDASDPATIDSRVAQPVRVYDYMLGGADNFEVDRVATENVADAVGGMDPLRSGVRANARFVGRAVRYVVGEAGVRQLVVVGTAIPGAVTIHGLAQEVAPETRVVYVGSGSMLLAHAHALQDRTAAGATVYVPADLRDVETIVAQAKATLDFGRPVALLLVGLLHHFRNDAAAREYVSRLVAAVPSGSHLVLSHLAADIYPRSVARFAALLSAQTDGAWVPRTRAEVGRFLEGLDLVPPGLVLVDEWRPADPPPARPGGAWSNPLHVGVGRKP
jgi:hypothetical protein